VNPPIPKSKETYAIVQLSGAPEEPHFGVTRERGGQPDLRAKFYEQQDAIEYMEWRNQKVKA
jgi:hypothetical protein